MGWSNPFYATSIQSSSPTKTRWRDFIYGDKWIPNVTLRERVMLKFHIVLDLVKLCQDSRNELLSVAEKDPFMCTSICVFKLCIHTLYPFYIVIKHHTHTNTCIFHRHTTIQWLISHNHGWTFGCVSIIVNFCYRTIPINATIIFMRVTLKSKAGLRLQTCIIRPSSHEWGLGIRLVVNRHI